MLAYVLDVCRQAGVEKILVVVGYDADQVKKHFSEQNDITWVIQKEQKGTAHAILCCKKNLSNFNGQTLVLCGDGPLIETKTIKVLIKKHESSRSAASLATAVLENPSGYGRIIRDKYGNIEGIVEDSDCNSEQKNINEVNPSYYLFDNKILFNAVEKVQPDNLKNEYYLTDALSIILSEGHKVSAVMAVSPQEAKSVNNRTQLSEAGKIMQQRIQKRLMENGVTIVAPETTWIDAKAEIGQDTVIEPFTYIQGKAQIQQKCRIGPFAYIKGNVILQHGSNVKPGSIVSEKNTKKFAWRD